MTKPEFSFFSFKRLWAMIIKEFVQMRRDKVTQVMILGIPIIQLILFSRILILRYQNILQK